MTAVRWTGTANAILMGVVFVGCGGDARDPGDTVRREGEPPVVYVADDDPKMAAAVASARSTVDQFIAALDNPKPSQTGFSVKLPIKDGEHVEHMWVLPVHYKDGKFRGTINNEPDKVRTVKIGDEVEVAREQVSDWMYIENRKLKGGYTIRALRDSMKDTERNEFDRSVPFTIE